MYLSLQYFIITTQNTQYHISNTHLADREVKSILKTRSGDIIALCNTNEDWAPRSKRGAIYDIENEEHTYFIKFENKRINISVENSLTSKHLIARDFSSQNNVLLNLPDEVISNKRVQFER